MKRVFFDVGANDGSSLIHLTNDPNNVVYAFEPTPRMIDIIASKTKHLENYHIIPKAVSNYKGMAKFHISGQADWGCSSLAEFNDNLEETWPGRTDFKVTETIEVEVITLRDFVLENDIKEIEHLHVDAQGHDLEVVMGLGDCLNRVKTGVIEMPSSHEKKLYKNQQYLGQDAVDFLQKNGFKVTGTYWNDHFQNEMNIAFERI